MNFSQHRSDQELVQAYRQESDPEAFRLLYERYWHRVFNQVQRIVQDRALAEDITQEAFLKLQQRLDKYAGKAQFSTWLYRFVHNLTLDTLKRHPVPSSSWQEDTIRVAEPEADEIAQLDREYLERILDYLHPDEREILLLKYGYGWPLEEIAEHFSANLSAVKMRVNRARKKAQLLHNKFPPSLKRLKIIVTF